MGAHYALWYLQLRTLPVDFLLQILLSISLTHMLKLPLFVMLLECQHRIRQAVPGTSVNIQPPLVPSLAGDTMEERLQ